MRRLALATVITLLALLGSTSRAGADDCNSNGVPDDIDIAGGTSPDCNSNNVPDECEFGGTFTWAQPVDGNWFDPGPWIGDCSPFSGSTVLIDAPGTYSVDYSFSGDTPAIFAPEIADLTLSGATGIATLNVFDFLFSTGPIHIDDGAQIFVGFEDTGNMGVVDGGPIRVGPGQRLEGNGIIWADVINAGTIASAPHPITGGLWMCGSTVTNEPGGILSVEPGSAMFAYHGRFTQDGVIRVYEDAEAVVTDMLVNSNGAAIELYGGTMGGGPYANARGGTIQGFGTLHTDMANSGLVYFTDDSVSLGGFTNEATGILDVLSGTLRVKGNLMGDGSVFGGSYNVCVQWDYTIEGGYPEYYRDGGDVQLGADALLQLGSDGVIRFEDDFDLAINDSGRFDAVDARLQADGASTVNEPQEFECASTDIGPDAAGLDAVFPGHFPIGELRIGPSATYVVFVDNHDNDGQAGPEAVYVHRLVLDAGVTLVLNGLKVYCKTLSQHPTATVDTSAGGAVVRLYPFGDFDFDGDVDLEDYEVFELCLSVSGPDSPPPFQECLDVFDADNTQDVDLADYAAFQASFGG